jgi:hypothetical protein
VFDEAARRAAEGRRCGPAQRRSRASARDERLQVASNLSGRADETRACATGEPSPIAHWLSTIARMEDLVMLEQTNII